MPDYKNHQRFVFLLIGLVVFIAVLIYQYNLGNITLITLGSITGIALIYAILPDCDSRASKIRQIIYILLWTSMLLISIMLITINYNPTSPYSFTILQKISELRLLIAQFIISLVGIGILFLKHRGIMHTNLAGLLLSVPLAFVNLLYFPVGFVAYSSHLLLDNITKK